MVIVHRLGAHGATAAQEGVEVRGATFVMLPPYSPDLTPVEEAGARIEGHVCGAAPQTFDALMDAMRQAIEAVPPPTTLAAGSPVEHATCRGVPGSSVRRTEPGARELTRPA